MIEIIPTYVPHDSEDLALGAEKVRTFASNIHIDVDDGIFAPHITWPYVREGVFDPFDLAALAALDVEIHLMVAQPREIGMAFARAGALRILGHVEAFASEDEAHTTLKEWRKEGASEVGLGILLGTPLEVLDHHRYVVDSVHMMSIATIGVQGIPYEPSAPERIRALHERYPDILIGVDGGVSPNNIADLVRAGARRFGVGSAISKSDNPKAAYESIKALAESATER